MNKKTITAITISAFATTLLSLHYGSRAIIYGETVLYQRLQSSKPWRYVSDRLTACYPESTSLEAYIANSAKHFKVSSDLISALIEVESNFKSDAIAFNPEGEAQYGRMKSAAHGYMQIRGVHAANTLCPEAKTVPDLYQTAINVFCGTRILRDALDHQPSLELALAAYNGGPRCIVNGVIACAESREHSLRVMAALGRRMYTK